MSSSDGKRAAPRLAAHDLTLAYGDTTVCRNLNFRVPTGALTAIIGPNGCGKSTVIKGLARALTPVDGSVTLDGTSLASMRAKAIARRIAYLPQHPIAPESMRVRDLVSRGRHPYHSVLRQWSPGDAQIIDRALEATSISHLSNELLTELSGGQRQRAWIAMVLAQDTDIILLDEPTSFLDIAYQVDVLDLARRIVDGGRTVVCVLHDINQAARYADSLLVMKEGAPVTHGSPSGVLSPALLEDVFGIIADIDTDPFSGTPRITVHRRA